MGAEPTTKVKIQSLEPYRHLFPPARAVDKTVKMGASVSDTVDFIPKVVRETAWQVEDFVNQELRGLSVYSVCEKLWYWVKYHIKYEKDERGIEQVRSPRRLVHDGKGDCDCMTTFISACLHSLKIPYITRITKYTEPNFQHIYPIVVVPLGKGGQIIMDCVASRFNYEVPYSEKKDYKMDLQFLDGIDERNFSGSVDAQDLFGSDMGDIGKLFKKKSSSAMPAENQGGKKGKKGFQKFKNVAKKVLNVTNKANPATALLRAGILASMKLNIMNVAGRLKWAYLTEEEAKKKGVDLDKFKKLKNVLYKAEQIFYTAGGSPDNLKKAILSGKGNKDKSVNGFGLIDPKDIQAYGIGPDTNISELLGDMYQDEFVNGLEGVEGLGSAAAAGASIAAASTVMTALAGLLKAIGSIFPKKEGEKSPDEGGGSSEDGSSEEGSSNEGGGESYEEKKSEESGEESDPEGGDEKKNNSLKKKEDDSGDEDSDKDNEGTSGTKKKNEVKKSEEKGLKGFWENNKKWLKPTGITVAIAGVIYAGLKLFSGKSKPDNKAPATAPGPASLAGVSKKKNQQKGKSKGGKKSFIDLM